MGERPFRGSVAIENGRMTVHELYRDYERVYRDVYVRKGTKITARLRALAAAEYAGPDAVLVGKSAAAMHNAEWLSPDDPAEVVRRTNCRAPVGMVLRRYALDPDEICRRGGIAVTTPARTGFDLGRSLERDAAVVALDALCHATNLDPTAIDAIVARHPRAPGIDRLRIVLDLVDGGAESPPESMTRLLLIDAGLPRPATQVYVRDSAGGVIARCDLGWEEWKVVVEYDGADHWARGRRAVDIERYALIEEWGWSAVKVGAELLNDRPRDLVERVRRKLRDAGADV